MTDKTRKRPRSSDSRVDGDVPTQRALKRPKTSDDVYGTAAHWSMKQKSNTGGGQHDDDDGDDNDDDDDDSPNPWEELHSEEGEIDDPSLSEHRVDEEHGMPPIKKHGLSHEYIRLNCVNDGRGRGGFNAGVFVVERRSDGLVCVEKRLRPRDVADYRHRYEVGLLRRLVHPHIVRFIDAYELPRANPPVASIYMDYYSLGSLRSFVVRQHDMCRLHGPAGTRFPEAFVWHVLRSLVSALVYLRNGSSSVADERRQPVVQPAPPTDWRPVLHRDIKADNVLVRPRRPALAPLQRLDAQPSSRSGRGSRQQQTQQQQRRRHERQQRLRRRHEPPPGVAPYPDIALGDFGSATFAPRDEALARVGTTPLYRRPAEVPTQDLRGRTDVWFVGSIAKMVARMHAEYDALYGGDATADARTDRLPAGAAYSDALNAVLAWALAADVRHRPDAEDLMDLVNQAYDRGHVRWEAIPTACRECGRFWPPAAADGDRHDDDDLQDDEE